MFKLNALSTNGGAKFGFGLLNGNIPVLSSVCSNIQSWQAIQAMQAIQVRHNTSPFPHRPGYGLGSMLPPGLIDGMREEAAIRSKIVAYDRLIDDLEATERKLLLEKNQIRNNLDNSQTLSVNKKMMSQGIKRISQQRKRLMNDKINAMIELAQHQTKVVGAGSGQNEENENSEEGDGDNENSNNNNNNSNNNRGFSTFASNVESPIDWNGTKIDSFARANEGIAVSSQFFDINTQQQKGSSHAENVAASIGATIKESTPTGLSQASSDLATSVHNSVTSTMQQHTVESTLVLTAIATHRWVKQLVPLKIDAKKLVHAWNYYHRNTEDRIEMATLTNMYTFQNELSKASEETLADGTTIPRTIAMVSEEFLGSAMVGMVHFIKREDTNTTQRATSVSASMTAEMQMATWLSSLTGSSAIMAQAANKAMSSFSQTGIDVVFNVVVQGYMPTLKSSIVKDSIKEFTAFSPKAVDVTNDATLMSDQGMSNAASMKDAKAIGYSQSVSGSMIKATIQGLHEAYENSYNVLDYNTFMTTFDDYVKNAPKDKNAGIPVGMNVKQWTRGNVLYEYRILARQMIEAQMKKQREEDQRRERERRQRLASIDAAADQ